MPPKLARFAGQRGPAYVPGEDEPLADPRFIIPAATTAAGVAVSEPGVENRLTGGLKGLLTGLGGVGGGVLGHHLTGNMGGTLAGGATGGILSLLLAKKLLDDKEGPYNTVRFRKKR